MSAAEANELSGYLEMTSFDDSSPPPDQRDAAVVIHNISQNHRLRHDDEFLMIPNHADCQVKHYSSCYVVLVLVGYRLCFIFVCVYVCDDDSVWRNKRKI